MQSAHTPSTESLGGGPGLEGDGGRSRAAASARCVACATHHPTNGKILSCLHVVCQTCLLDALTSAGSFKCNECKEETCPPPGVELSRLLISSKDYLSAEDSVDGASGTGRSATPTCAFCTDETSSVATHRCSHCQNAYLCDEHAANHSEKRIYSGHSVVPLPSASGGASSAAGADDRQHRQDMCSVHHAKPLTDYCVKCQCLVCERCVDAGHATHELTSIAAAALKQRLILKEYVSTGHHFYRTGRPEMVHVLESLLRSMDLYIEFVETQGQRAAQTVAERFADIESAVAAQKKTALAQVDDLQRQLAFPFLDRRQRLETTLSQNANAIALASSFASPDSADVDVLKMAPHVNSRMEQLADVVARASIQLARKEIVVNADKKRAREVQAALEHYVTVSSRRERVVTVAESFSTSASTSDLLSIDSGRSTLSSLGEAEHTSGPLLNPNHVSHGIIVSADGRKAARSKGTGFGNIVGCHCHKHGIYQWHFKLAGASDVDVGVTSLPLQYGLQGHASDSTAFVWNGQQKSRGLAGQQTNDVAKMSKWKKNDELTMMLDCDRHTLEMYLHRTGEWRTLTDVRCPRNKGLYLYVYLWGTGNCIEFLN